MKEQQYNVKMYYLMILAFSIHDIKLDIMLVSQMAQRG